MNNPVAKNVHKFYKNFVFPNKNRIMKSEEMLEVDKEELEEFLTKIKPSLDEHTEATSEEVNEFLDNNLERLNPVLDYLKDK